MNIFILDTNIKKCAEYHNDKHVVKMILESAQILSTVCRQNGINEGYKITHKNHPCTKWAGQSLSNWRWLKQLALELNEEFKYRFNHSEDHKSSKVICSLPEPKIPDRGLTNFVQAMPDDCKMKNPVKAYRRYYKNYKQHLASWKNRRKPKWYRGCLI